MARAGKVCIESGCGRGAVDKGRCGPCGRAKDMARGTTTSRGYGSTHQAIRQALLDRHIEGTLCSVCGLPMWREQGLDAAHKVGLRKDRNSKASELQHSWCNRGDTR